VAIAGGSQLSHQFVDSGWGPYATGQFRPDQENFCGVHGGHYCTATATTVGLDDFVPWGGCAWHPGTLPIASSPSAPTLGPDSARTLKCFVSMHVEPAQVLEAVQSVGPYVTIFIPSPGQLSLRPRPEPGFAAVNRPRPAIAPITTMIGQPGPSKLTLRLNAPAKRLLARRHSLPVALAMTFTPASGPAITRTTRITLRSAAKRPTRCGIHKPTRRLKRLQKACHLWRHT
jgi:hypothetical protein